VNSTESLSSIQHFFPGWQGAIEMLTVQLTHPPRAGFQRFVGTPSGGWFMHLAEPLISSTLLSHIKFSMRALTNLSFFWHCFVHLPLKVYASSDEWDSCRRSLRCPFRARSSLDLGFKSSMYRYEHARVCVQLLHSARTEFSGLARWRLGDTLSHHPVNARLSKREPS